MAVKTLRVVECDKCGAKEDLTTYSIGRGGRPRRVDLCPKHNKQIDQLYELARPVARTGRKPRIPVMTMKEVEEAKKASTKK